MMILKKSALVHSNKNTNRWNSEHSLAQVASSRQSIAWIPSNN